MKKYWGKREWSESLYYVNITREMFDDDDEYERFGFSGYEAGEKFDWRHIMGFDDKNTFEDTNDFITYSEIFNIYQFGKI